VDAGLGPAGLNLKVCVAEIDIILVSRLIECEIEMFIQYANNFWF
jgi:hypothetical protein